MMEQYVSFPGLGIERIDLNRVAFTIGSWPVYWYGVILGLAFIIGVGFICWRSPKFGLNWDRSLDILSFSILGGLVCARIYYVVFTWENYKDNLLSVFMTWKGGIAIYGGIIGGFLVGWLLCKKYKVHFLAMADASVGGLIIGQAIGRWGNFVNVEAFGANTTLPWGMSGPPVTAYLTMMQSQLASFGVAVDPNLPVHPTFLYESLWNFLGFFVLLWYANRRKFDGELALLYCLWYGAGRAVIEGLRTDSLMWGNVRVSQALAAVTAVVCILLIGVLRRKNNLPPLYVTTEEGQKNASIKPFTKTSAEQEETTSQEEDASSQEDADKASSEEGDASAREDEEFSHPQEPNSPLAEETEDASADLNKETES